MGVYLIPIDASNNEDYLGYGAAGAVPPLRMSQIDVAIIQMAKRPSPRTSGTQPVADIGPAGISSESVLRRPPEAVRYPNSARPCDAEPCRRIEWAAAKTNTTVAAIKIGPPRIMYRPHQPGRSSVGTAVSSRTAITAALARAIATDAIAPEIAYSGNPSPGPAECARCARTPTANHKKKNDAGRLSQFPTSAIW